MFNFHQSKNIINTVLIISLSVLLGEGVMGLGFFWPFLLILLDWRWIYWLSISVGVLISAIYRLPVGLPSLFLVRFLVLIGISGMWCRLWLLGLWPCAGLTGQKQLKSTTN